MSIESNIQPERYPRGQDFYRYIGLVALAHDSKTNTEYLSQQIITELAESIDAQMGTHGIPIPLSVINGHIIDSNGSNMTSSARDWAVLQSDRAKHDANLAWFARMALIEASEHEDIAQFAIQASVGDAMVVISPFPEDVVIDSKNGHTVAQEGFRIDTKRAFIRVYQKTDVGAIGEHVQSVDASDMRLWNKTLSDIGLPGVISRESLLQQRFTFRKTNAEDLLAMLCNTYDKFLHETTGIQHTYGRSDITIFEANEFVKKHSAIVTDTINELREITQQNSDGNKKAEQILYNSKALINTLYEQQRDGRDVSSNIDDVRRLRYSEGAAAASIGRVFYGCSGESTFMGTVADSSQGQMIHNQSFTIKSGKRAGNFELVDIGSCPMCKTECIQGVYDPKSKRWVSCTVKGCKAYNQDIIDSINGVRRQKNDTKNNWFADACRFWGIAI